jgi:Flp pilus assembly CpaE family ATPase
MNQISVAIALQSGEIGSKVIGLVEEHPLLDFCGAARSIPDLMRLLDRFRPQILLISASILEDMGQGLGDDELRKLAQPLSFLLFGLDEKLNAEGLASVLGRPLRYCGLMKINEIDGEELFRRVKEKLSLYSSTIRPGRDVGNSDTGRDVGRFIVMAGCKGGVGATLLSCTLAAAVASCGRRVLLMDMDTDLSQLLHISGGEAGKNLVDLLPIAEDISWDLIHLSVTRHPSGFYLLPYGLRSYDSSDNEDVFRAPLLRNMLFLFDAVIMDYPRALRRDFLALLNHNPTLVLVSQADTLSANCARRRLAFVRRSGLEANRMRLVLNRCGSHHALAPEELARATGLDLLALFPKDDRSGRDFAELGQVPRPDSNLAKVANLMASSLGFEVEPESGPARKGFKSLRPRLQGAQGWIS